MAIIATILGVSLPMASNAIASARLNSSARGVERELQTARLKAVSTNRKMRVRFNCPTTGAYRMIEVTGVAATDSAPNRCSETVYPYPTPRDQNRATPAADGPVRTMENGTSLAGTYLGYEFEPNGTTRAIDVSGALVTFTGDVTLTVSKGSQNKTVLINALGKIRLQ